jgi:hypothetical protein
MDLPVLAAMPEKLSATWSFCMRIAYFFKAGSL